MATKKFTEQAVDMLHHELEVFSESLDEVAPKWLKELCAEHVEYMHDSINECLEEPNSRSAQSRLKRYAYLHHQKTALKARVDAINIQMGTLEEKIKDHLNKLKARKIQVIGKNHNSTISINRELWFKYPEGVTNEDVGEVLKKSKKYKNLVKKSVNVRTLTGLVREFDREKENEGDEVPIPKALQGVVSYSEVFKVKVTKS